jgi:hypothetical protein
VKDRPIQIPPKAVPGQASICPGTPVILSFSVYRAALALARPLLGDRPVLRC